MSVLYIVATPVGNLEDISLRALRVLREVKLIAAEDTRKTKHLLTAYDIKTPVTSYHEHNKWSKLDYVLGCLGGGDVALVCNAGTPGIADPGYELIVAASQRGFPVVPIPGPSIVIMALVVSGLPMEKFVYLGFPPRKVSDRRRLLESVTDESGTIVILEAPHRLLATLDDVRLILGDREMAVCRELTKVHEEVFRGRVSQAMEYFAEPRGEFTLVVAGRVKEDKPRLTEDIRGRLSYLRRSGATAKEAVAEVGKETGLSRRELYQAWLKLP